MNRKPKAAALQIVISGRSGYVPAQKEYSDKLIITDHSIEYECNPYEPWKMNPNQKWSFTTNSIAFRKLFELTVDAVHEIFRRNPKCPGTDMPETVFSVTYRNGKTRSRDYLTSSDEFKDCFAIIKKMIPGCELMPGVLQTSEDYKEWRLWNEIVDRYYQDEITYAESAVLSDAMWDLELKRKTDKRCPRCGSELGISVVGDSARVFCKKKGCISVTRRGP